MVLSSPIWATSLKNQQQFMNLTRPISSHDSNDSKRGHVQLQTLPSIREIAELGVFLPRCRDSSRDRQNTPNVAFPVWDWDGGSATPSLRGRWYVPGQQQDGLLVRDSIDGVLTVYGNRALSSEESFRRASLDAHEPDDGGFPSDTEIVRNQHRAEDATHPTIDSTRKSRQDADIRVRNEAALKSRISKRTSSNKGLKKQDKDNAAAITHMMMERRRRLDIGDLIKQLASHVEADGPKVEILKSTVNWIIDAKCKKAELETELANVRSQCQILSQQCSKPWQAPIRNPSANAEEACSKESSMMPDVLMQRKSLQEELYYAKEDAVVG
ncbi:MAG: hypothetical protein Q9166_006052 [cf. Caloplaca sp. 2 TL-2023]